MSPRAEERKVMYYYIDYNNISKIGENVENICYALIIMICRAYDIRTTHRVINDYRGQTGIATILRDDHKSLF